jgi:hypothetical protein
MSVNKRQRDSSGKFTCEGSGIAEETSLWTISRILRIVKIILTIIVVIVISMPWGMLMVEPAKQYGIAWTTTVTNFTGELKDNFCGCSLPPRKAI